MMTAEKVLLKTVAICLVLGLGKVGFAGESYLLNPERNLLFSRNKITFPSTKGIHRLSISKQIEKEIEQAIKAGEASYLSSERPIKMSKWEMLENLSFWDIISSEQAITLIVGFLVILMGLGAGVLWAVDDRKQQRAAYQHENRILRKSISTWRGAVSSRDETIAQRNKALEESYQKINQLNSQVQKLQLTPRGDQLTQEAVLIKHQLSLWQRAVGERDEIIKQVRQQIEQLNLQLSQKNQTVLEAQEKHQQLLELTQIQAKELNRWRDWDSNVGKTCRGLVEQSLKDRNREAQAIIRNIFDQIYGQEKTQQIFTESESAYRSSLPKGDTRDIRKLSEELVPV
jgi:hypothetical protein